MCLSQLLSEVNLIPLLCVCYVCSRWWLLVLVLVSVLVLVLMLARSLFDVAVQRSSASATLFCSDTFFVVCNCVRFCCLI
jgi:hypothetical protein